MSDIIRFFTVAAVDDGSGNNKRKSCSSWLLLGVPYIYQELLDHSTCTESIKLTQCSEKSIIVSPTFLLRKWKQGEVDTRSWSVIPSEDGDQFMYLWAWKNMSFGLNTTPILYSFPITELYFLLCFWSPSPLEQVWSKQVEIRVCDMSRGFEWTCWFGLSLIFLGYHEKSLFNMATDAANLDPWLGAHHIEQTWGQCMAQSPDHL
jgi:hypothetical protein